MAVREEKRTRCEFVKRCVRISVPIFLLLFAALISADAPNTRYGDIKFERFSLGEGLYQGTISNIYQDIRGFMWFGTQHGLHRYDGYTFKMYEYDPRKPNSLSHDLVGYICGDRSGYLWIGTLGGGINKFDPKKEEFTIFKNDPGNPRNSLSNNNVNIIVEEKQTGILWVGTYKGLNRFDPKKYEFTPYLGSERINTICIDGFGILWVGTNDGVFRSDRDRNTFNRFRWENNLAGPGHKKIRAIYEEKPGMLWIGTDSGLHKFVQEKGQYTHLPEITNTFNEACKKPIAAIFKDKEGNLWIGTNGKGLYIFNVEKKKFTNYKNKSKDLSSLSHDNVTAFFQDKADLIWIGTGGGGFNKFDPWRQKFEVHRNIPGDSNSLNNNEVRGICEGKGGIIWIGTGGGGVNRFDPNKKEFTPYKILGDAASNLNRISAVFEDHEGVLWVGTFRSGLFLLKPGQKDFEPYPDESIRTDEYILTIYEDKEDELWIGTEENGLIKIDKKRKEAKNYKNTSEDNNSLSNNRIYSITEDNFGEGILWIGTGGGGLIKLNKKTGDFVTYLPKEADPNSLSHNIVASLHVDQKEKDRLWVGTGGGGLNKFDRIEETFKAYTTRDGLPDNVIYAILEDSEGNLWLSTNKGLSKFDPGKEEFRNYSIRDGLQGYEFNRGAALKSADGKMYIGGFNGFNVFKPEEIKHNPFPPPIAFTSFKKRNQEVILPKSISEIEELDLSYKDTSISFEFAALSFSDPESNKYKYKLEPVDKEWTDLGNKHVVDLINLKPRAYTFRVKGSNNDGVWNEEGKSIKITVNPPFWETWWFYTLVVLFIGSAIFSSVRWRFGIKEKANIQLKKEVDERKRAEELYRNLVETSPDAITLSEVETGKIMMANRQAANLLGYNSEEEMRREIKTIFDIYSQMDHERAKKIAEEIKISGVNRNTEYTLISKDKTPIDVEISTSLIRDTDGNPTYFLSITRDIRKRKEAERQEKMRQERLVQIDKMVALGTLVSGVAHELNNPAASIKMNSGNFARVWEDITPILDKYYERNKDFKLVNIPYRYAKPRLEDLILGLLESGQRIERIIDVLRNFARPEDISARQSIDINKVIKTAVDLTDNIIKQATKNFSLIQSRNLPLFKGNYQRLEQVFINLIQNACQSLPNDSLKITISTHYEQMHRQIIVKVKDEGVGIEEKNLKHITDPFFTTKRDKGGIGIGLSISSQILQDHGGSMNFESTIGKGTTVTVNLPVT